MKRVIIISTVMMVALFSSFFSSLFGDSISEKRKLAINISSKLAKQFKLKYNLNYMGISEEAKEGKYKVVGMELNCKKVLSRNEGRKLLLQCAKDILAAFNSEPKFKKYMLNYPFTGNNIHINIYIQPPNYSEVYHPDINVFSFYDNTLFYKTNTPEVNFRYFSKEKESFEEAMRLVESQK